MYVNLIIPSLALSIERGKRRKSILQKSHYSNEHTYLHKMKIEETVLG